MNIKKVLILMAFGLFYSSSYGQLSGSFNLNSVFNFNQGPQLMFKYELGNNMAVRLAATGNRNHAEGIQNFFEDDAYTNLNKWPSHIPMTGYSNTNSNIGIRPGVEFRKHVNEQTFVYAGVDLTYAIFQGNWSNNFHNAQMVGPDMYTIYQIRKFESTSKTISISPSLLIGVNREISHGFSLFLEASINSTHSRSDSESENLIYNWNGGTEQFDELEQPKGFKDQDLPWMSAYNFTPTVQLWLAYTFGKS